MRVIAGTNRGKSLSVPPGMTTRPTSDRVKESLFSILSSRIDFEDVRVLDICAGTGSLGIEALSRGAASCSFIESNPSVKVVLEKNILATGSLDQSEVLNMDALRALNSLAGRGRCYDLVFFDPPYDSELYKSVPELLASSSLLASDSILLVECSVRNQLAESYGRLKRFDRRVYGDTALEFFTVEKK